MFGDWAFLSMTRTGEATLTKDDVALLDTGFLTILPDDNLGNPVVCYDRSRLPPDLQDPDGAMRMRCMFYILSVLAETRGASTVGFVGLEISSTSRPHSLRDHFTDLADEVFPVHLKAVHLIHNPADSFAIGIKSV